MTTKPPILILNPRKRTQLFWMTAWIPLTPTQYRILRLLADNLNQVVDQNRIYYAITQGEADIEPAQVHWHMTKIKGLLQSLSGHPIPITNIPARGYTLELPEMSVILQPEATDVPEH